MIEFPCPECGAVLRVSENGAGKPGQCHNCRALVRVPPKPEPVETPRRPKVTRKQLRAGAATIMESLAELVATLVLAGLVFGWFAVGVMVIAEYDIAGGVLVWIAGLLVLILLKLGRLCRAVEQKHNKF